MSNLGLIGLIFVLVLAYALTPENGLRQTQPQASEPRVATEAKPAQLTTERVAPAEAERPHAVISSRPDTYNTYYWRSEPQPSTVYIIQQSPVVTPPPPNYQAVPQQRSAELLPMSKPATITPQSLPVPVRQPSNAATRSYR